MIRTYVRVELSSEGESPKQVIERMRKIGAVPVVGDYDFELPLADDERLFDKLEEIHRVLQGSGVRYTITTRTDVDTQQSVWFRQPFVHYLGQKPVELRKAVYRAKLERWREMGLDVSELEELLEKDLDRFKSASKEFLRTHLDRMAVIRDKRPADNVVDGEILALLDERGKTLEELVAATGYFEDQVTLSLGRLISSGSAKRVQDGARELYCLIPPPAPIVRRAVKVVPAKSDDEAMARAYSYIPKEGILVRDLVQATRLPRDQLKKALALLEQKGSIRVDRSGKKETCYRL